MSIEVSPELLAFLKEEEVRSRNEDLLDRAEACLRAYRGEPYGDEEDGRSQVVTRDVAEVCDHMGVSVLRTFVSGDRVVEFEPDNPDAEQFADDATEAIQRQFSRKGYALLHDWLKEGNISILGIVKTVAEQKKRRVEGIVPEALLPDNAHEAEPLEGDDSGLGLMRVVTLEDGPPEFKDYLVPLEEFRVSPDARDVDEAAYVAHAVPKTLSELVEMGFDREEVENIPSSEDFTTELGNARDDHRSFWGDDRAGALRKVLLLEEYVRFDADGDGIAERLCVHRVGDTILRIEPVDYQPFVVYCPFPMPGRLAGHSLAENVTDIQRVRTVLRRLHLDGLYCNLAPGYIVPDTAVNANTYDDLLHVRPNRIIRTTGNGEIKPEPKNDVSAIALTALESLIGERESRTGITRLNQGLDADTLNKTATGTALMQAQGQQMEEYIARNFAEAVARLMRLKLKLFSRYGQPMKLRVEGEYRDINPQDWPEDMDVVIRVGLGSGKKEQRLANRMTLLQIQREVMLSGMPIVGPEHIYKSISGVVKDASLGSPTDFVVDPETLKVADPETGEMVDPPSPPSPEEKKLEAETQLQAAKLQGEQQIQAAKAEAMREEAQIKAELARQVAQEEAQLAREKAMFEAELARGKMALERELAFEKMQIEAEIAVRNEARRDREVEAKVSQNRPGGDLDK
jgi:hypothetical protein